MVDQTNIVPRTPASGPVAARRSGPALRSPRRGLRRAALAVVAFSFSLVVLVALGVAVLFALLARGDIPVDISAQIAAALNERVGGGYAFTVGSTAIAETSHGPSLAINAVAVKDGAGRTIVAAPRATVSVDLAALLAGRISPKRLDMENVDIHLVRLEDGSIAMAAGADQEADTRLSTLFSSLAKAREGPGPGADGPSTDAASAPGAGAAAAAAAPDLPAMVAKAVGGASDLLFGPGGPLHAVDRLGLREGTLVFADRLRGTTTTYHNLGVDFDRLSDSHAAVSLGADGPAGHWSLDADVTRATDGTRTAVVKAAGLSYDELILGGGIRTIFFETDMPLSFDVTIAVAPDGRLREARGPVSFGPGYFKLDDPDHEPAMVDRFEATLAMDTTTGAVTLGQGTLVADATHFAFEIGATPPPAAGDPWAFAGKATGVFGAERPGEKPIALDRIAFGAHLFPAAHRFVLDEASAGGPEVAFGINASVEPTDTGLIVKSAMDMGRMPAPVVMRLWPNWIAAPVRQWLIRNVQAGYIDRGHGQLSLTDTDLNRMRAQHSVQSDRVHIDFDVSGGTLGFMDGVPPLRNLEGKGLLTGDSFTFTASKADMEVSPGHRLTASEGSFVVPATDPKPTPATIGMRVAGDIDAVAELLSRESLKAYADVPLDAAAVSGSFDGRLTVGLKIGTHDPKGDTSIGVVATTKDFSAAKVIGKEALQDATLNVTADRKGLHAKGDGRMFGAPAAVELSKPSGGGASEASILLTLDDAARQKAGFSFGKSVTGTMTAKISTSLTPSDKQKANVALDFTRCAFDAPIPGLKKAAGRPAKATLTVTQDTSRTLLDQIAFDSGSTSIRGNAVLDPNSGLASATLSQLRLSPGDDAKVDIGRAGDGYKVAVRGANIDARPFLKYVTGNEGAGGGPGKDLDLDIHANILTGQNAQALSGVDLRLVKHGTQLRKLQMSGRLGKGAIAASTTGPGEVVVAAKDAGAMLSFLDLYNRMDGGQLDATLRFGDDKMDGTAIIHNFTIREDPSIKKLAQEDIASNKRSGGTGIDPSAVSFTKLEAVFTRVGNKVDVRQGSMFGPQLGATVDGSIDFGHDRVALSGTFVPLYGINNLFSQIPLVGPLLGGGAHEGLFALNYRINGPASAPVLSFNPLSALAPGFLRKIFGAIDDAAQQGIADQQHDQGDTPTSSTAPAAPQ